MNVVYVMVIIQHVQIVLEHLMGLQVLINVVYAPEEILELNHVFKIAQVIGVEQLLKMYVEYVMDLVIFMNVVVQILLQVLVIAMVMLMTVQDNVVVQQVLMNAVFVMVMVQHVLVLQSLLHGTVIMMEF